MRWRKRFTALLPAVLLVAHAGGARADWGLLNMSWSNCVGDGPVVPNIVSACNSNAGSHRLVCSFVAPSNVTHFGGAEFLVDLISQSSPLPSWWAFYNSGSCRQASLTVNTQYAGSGAVCASLWALAPGAGGVASYGNPLFTLPGINAGNVAQYATIDAALGVAEGSEFALVPGQEYFLANIVIDNALTTGAGSCGGCTDPVCLSFTRLSLFQPGQPDVYISTAGNSVVTWQGTGANCAAVPVKRVTWGAIKSLYR